VAHIDIGQTGAPTQGTMQSGLYYFTGSVSTTTGSSPNGQMRVSPFIIPNPVTLARIGAEVTTIGDAGSKLRLGIYADAGGNPGALIVDAGQIAGDSVSVQELTINVTLSPGVYWAAVVTQSVTTTAPNLRTVANWTPPVPIFTGNTIPPAASAVYGLSMTGVTAALPGTFSNSGGAVGVMPRTFVKVA
jgi:hypothetical protein